MTDLHPIDEKALRQYIDAESAFEHMASLSQRPADLQGTMFWRSTGGRDYLIRQSPQNRQTSLGPRSPETEAIRQAFVERQASAKAAFERAKQTLDSMVRMNRALRVGRTPEIVVRLLRALDAAGLGDQFMVIGTHALYAYEHASGHRFEPAAMATRDIDLMADTRKMKIVPVGNPFHAQGKAGSFLALLQKVDKTFQLAEGKKETAVNADLFEVDVVRPPNPGIKPVRMSADEGDLWAVEIASGHRLLGPARFSQVVVATSGKMATMHTADPAAFVRVKRRMAEDPQRDPLKRRRDLMQAQAVDALLGEGWLRSAEQLGCA